MRNFNNPGSTWTDDHAILNAAIFTVGACLWGVVLVGIGTWIKGGM